MRSRDRVVLGGLAVGMLMLAACVEAQAQKVSEQQMRDALVALNAATIDSPQVTAWHMQAHFSIAADAKYATQDGTMDVWMSGGDMRSVTAVGGAATTLVRHDGAVYASGPVSSAVLVAQVMLSRVLHPGPLDQELAAAKLASHAQTFGKVAANCIQEGFTGPSDGKPSPEHVMYCLSASDNEAYLLTSQPSNVWWIAVRTGKFGAGRLVMQVEQRHGREVRSSFTVDLLRSEASAASAFGTDGLTHVELLPVKGGWFGNLLAGSVPEYPEPAHTYLVGGGARIEAVLGTDGRLASVTATPLKPRDRPFADEAKKSVALDRYRPFMLNDVAVPAQTESTMEFDIH